MLESSPAKRWFDKAKDDLVAAEKLQGIPETSSSIVAFHAQQAAEKYLKGFLIHHEVEPPRTHDLEEILGRGSEIEEDIDRLRSTVVGLTDYGVAPRYPDTGIKVSPHDAEQALRAAQEVQGLGSPSCVGDISGATSQHLDTTHRATAETPFGKVGSPSYSHWSRQAFRTNRRGCSGISPT